MPQHESNHHNNHAVILCTWYYSTGHQHQAYTPHLKFKQQLLCFHDIMCIYFWLHWHSPICKCLYTLEFSIRTSTLKKSWAVTKIISIGHVKHIFWWSIAIRLYSLYLYFCFKIHPYGATKIGNKHPQSLVFVQPRRELWSISSLYVMADTCDNSKIKYYLSQSWRD